MTKPEQQVPTLVPVSKFNDWIPYPTIGSLRQTIFFNTGNFNEKVIRKIGKRIYIHIPSFYEWVEVQNGHKVSR